MSSLLLINIYVVKLIILAIPLTLFVYVVVDLIKSTFKEPAMKTMWGIIVLILPVLGPVLYLLFSPNQKIKIQ